MAEGDIEADGLLEKRIRMKPMRTQSGVAPVTVWPAQAAPASVSIPTTGVCPKAISMTSRARRAGAATALTPT